MDELSLVLQNPTPETAQRLLGCLLEREIDEQKIVAKIVEVEFYNQDDEASHTFRGQTPRNKTMFGGAGHMYVYFTYGMHHCCNIVVGQAGHGAGVLIRAVEPIEGIDLVELNRGGKTGVLATNGPGKVTQALKIDRQFNGHDLRQSPIKLIITEPLAKRKIVASKRVGISRAQDKLWRFYIKDNPYVSKK